MTRKISLAAICLAFALQAQEPTLAELRQVYTENHPSVRKAKADLERGDTAKPVLSQDEAIAAQRARLATLRETYTEKHPAVRKAKSDLEALERALALRN